MEGPAVVADYDPTWPADFRVIRDHVVPHLQSRVDVEHIGSTSVTGLPAKPIIDVDLVVASENDVPRVIEVLAAVGYEHQGNLGIVGREAFAVLPGRYHHLYVVVADSQPHHDHVDLRDYVRTDPAEAVSAIEGRS